MFRSPSAPDADDNRDKADSTATDEHQPTSVASTMSLLGFARATGAARNGSNIDDDDNNRPTTPIGAMASADMTPQKSDEIMIVEGSLSYDNVIHSPNVATGQSCAGGSNETMSDPSAVLANLADSDLADIGDLIVAGEMESLDAMGRNSELTMDDHGGHGAGARNLLESRHDVTVLMEVSQRIELQDMHNARQNHRPPIDDVHSTHPSIDGHSDGDGNGDENENHSEKHDAAKPDSIVSHAHDENLATPPSGTAAGSWKTTILCLVLLVVAVGICTCAHRFMNANTVSPAAPQWADMVDSIPTTTTRTVPTTASMFTELTNEEQADEETTATAAAAAGIAAAPSGTVKEAMADEPTLPALSSLEETEQAAPSPDLLPAEPVPSTTPPELPELPSVEPESAAAAAPPPPPPPPPQTMTGTPSSPPYPTGSATAASAPALAPVPVLVPETVMIMDSTPPTQLLPNRSPSILQDMPPPVGHFAESSDAGAVAPAEDNNGFVTFAQNTTAFTTAESMHKDNKEKTDNSIFTLERSTEQRIYAKVRDVVAIDVSEKSKQTITISHVQKFIDKMKQACLVVAMFLVLSTLLFRTLIGSKTVAQTSNQQPVPVSSPTQSSGDETDERRKATDPHSVIDLTDDGHADWDLKAYNSLTVTDLRGFLRCRDCPTAGRKAILVHRLVQAYVTELEALRVKDLRPLLKKKGCKQTGKKDELIQRLVELGPKSSL